MVRQVVHAALTVFQTGTIGTKEEDDCIPFVGHACWSVICVMSWRADWSFPLSWTSWHTCLQAETDASCS